MEIEGEAFAGSDNADGKAFAGRCAEDRHHFRFIVSTENAAQTANFRAFARDVMKDAERDLGTKMEWVSKRRASSPSRVTPLRLREGDVPGKRRCDKLAATMAHDAGHSDDAASEG
jgi:hypothetical protein